MTRLIKTQKWVRKKLKSDSGFSIGDVIMLAFIAVMVELPPLVGVAMVVTIGVLFLVDTLLVFCQHRRETRESKAKAEIEARKKARCKENPDEEGCDEYGWMA